MKNLFFANRGIVFRTLLRSWNREVCAANYVKILINQNSMPKRIRFFSILAIGSFSGGAMYLFFLFWPLTFQRNIEHLCKKIMNNDEIKYLKSFPHYQSNDFPSVLNLISLTTTILGVAAGISIFCGIAQRRMCADANINKSLLIDNRRKVKKKNADASLAFYVFGVPSTIAVYKMFSGTLQFGSLPLLHVLLAMSVLPMAPWLFSLCVNHIVVFLENRY